MTLAMRRSLPPLALTIALASCVPAKRPPAPAPPPPPAAPALPAAPPQQDWRDVPLTAGVWSWHGAAGQASIAQFLVPGQQAQFAMKCDFASRTIRFSRAGALPASAATMTVTTSFGIFTLPAGNGGGQPPAIVAQATARDPHLDQIAFSRGRFLIDLDGQPRLILPAWPEVARVIEDCRG